MTRVSVCIYIRRPPPNSRGSVSEKRGQEREQEARKQHLATAIASNFEPNQATTNCQTDAPHDGVQKATGGTGSRGPKAWSILQLHGVSLWRGQGFGGLEAAIRSKFLVRSGTKKRRGKKLDSKRQQDTR